MNTIENLKWRYATKQYNKEKKASEEQIENLKEVIQLSPSSYGMQLFKVMIIENRDFREKLRPFCWDQPQITDASHIFVFCNYASLSNEQINDYFQFKAKELGMEADGLKGYADFVAGKMSPKSDKEISHWTAKQTYIALGNALTACAEMKLDATPMEGFDADDVDELLGLKEKGLTTAVLMAVGYRSDADETQNAPKIRRPKEELFL